MGEGMYERTTMMIGEDGVKKLKNSSVILCGVGAVGGYALEGLVRAGIGRIRVVDNDVFTENNLNRQILATTATIGRRKVDAACERARMINPNIEIEGIDAFVDEGTIPLILKGDFDVLVDAIDTVKMKGLLLQAACENGIRTFSSMGAALHEDATSIRISPLKKTNVCPIASKMRRKLRDMDSSNITCVFSEEPPLKNEGGRDDNGKSVLGSLSTIPALFGMTLANEVIMHLLKNSDARGHVTQASTNLSE